MCGIAGTVRQRGDESVDPERLAWMCRTLRHRGPDDEGTYVADNIGLGVRRLAVIDVAGGHQPVHNEHSDVYAVLNGEIYNHQELRRVLTGRGHRFASSSDSEVIPHLYEEYGPSFVERLEGMFAIALWDAKQQRLLITRDRIGIKPLYYSIRQGGLVFASEIRAVLAAGVPTSLNPQALSDYLSLMYVPGPQTIYAEIQKLEPATTLIWQEGKIASWRYWNLAETSQYSDLSPVSAQSMLRELVKTSVDQQMLADVPVGFFLSGGIDSSSIVAAARYVRPTEPLRTFSIGFPDRSYDERDQAALVANHLGTLHTETCLEPSPEDVVDKIAPIFDEPFADPSIIPTYYLCELARQHVTVALSGDGGDELFAGYHTYKADKLARLYRRLPRALTAWAAPNLLRFLPTSHRRQSFQLKANRFVERALDTPSRSHYLWRVVLGEEQKAKVLQPDLFAHIVDSYQTHAPHDAAGARFDPLTRNQYTDANVYLVDDVLTKVDRLSMAHSLEVRVPLLSTQLVEYAFSLPGRLKMPGYQTKWLLRRTVEHALPPKIGTMRKKGFNAPMPRWLTQSLRPLVDEYLSADAVKRQGFLQPAQVRRLIDGHMAHKAEHSREIWILLMLSMWVEAHKAQR